MTPESQSEDDFSEAYSPDRDNTEHLQPVPTKSFGAQAAVVIRIKKKQEFVRALQLFRHMKNLGR